MFIVNKKCIAFLTDTWSEEKKRMRKTSVPITLREQIKPTEFAQNDDETIKTIHENVSVSSHIADQAFLFQPVEMVSA